MKAIYKLALLLSAGLFVAVSCHDKDDPVNPEPDEVQPVTKTLTFVLPENSVSGKTAWVAGDKIVVHGEYAKDQVTVTLAAGDISADGKKATLSVSGLYPYERDDVSSTLYAGYPADAVDNLKHCFFYTKFKDTNNPLMAACNTGDSFNFVDLCAAISFTVDGDYDSYILAGNKKETLGYGQYQVKITPDTQNYLQYTSDPIITLEGNMESGTNLVYIPNGVNLKSGLTIKLKKDGTTVKILKTADAEEITHGLVTDLGDITEEMIDYVDPFSADIMDIDAAGNANCYLVTEPGKYKFKAVRGNNPTAFLEDVDDAIVLWETWNNAEEVVAGSVIPTVSYAEDYIIFQTPDELHPGNAVLAARNSDGVIQWSWHIWVPSTAITTNTYGIYDKEMMDRNLGALVAAEEGVPSPIESFGLTYQWGRKDPFPGPSAPKASSNATIAGSVEFGQAEGTGSGDISKITLEQSIANPTLLGFSQNGDWVLVCDSDLWKDSEKTIYDPCPVGYRVPAKNANQPFHSSDLTTQEGWSESVDNLQFTLGSPKAVFPLAGYRDDYGPASMTHAYDRAVYWTAHASAEAITGSYVNVRSPNSKHAMSEAGKSRAGSVRCVVE